MGFSNVGTKFGPEAGFLKDGFDVDMGENDQLAQGEGLKRPRFQSTRIDGMDDIFQSIILAGLVQRANWDQRGLVS